MNNRKASTSKLFYRTLRKHALSIYTPPHAESYRLSDENYFNTAKDTGKFPFVRDAARSFTNPTILDVGCGTGRYFHCFNNAERIVAFDLSYPMLLQARNPIVGVEAPLMLLNGSIDEMEFKQGSFDLVFCMGVFGCSLPIDRSILFRVAQWLKPEGVFCFDAIERFLEPSHGTWRSRLAEKIQPYLLGPLKAYVEAKLMGFTISRENLETLVSEEFENVEIREMAGRGRMDFLCLARLRSR